MKLDSYTSAVATIGFLLMTGGAVWLYSRHEEIKTAVIDKKKSETAAYVKTRAVGLLKPEDFQDGDALRQRQVFRSFFDAVQSPELVRIKVWDRNLTVIWSNFDDLSGQRFPDNHEVQEALQGEVKFEIEKKKPEHFSERQFYELSETYVPISDAKGHIVGVVEVYQPTTSLREEIGSQFRKSALPAAATVVTGYGLLVSLLRLFMTRKKMAVSEKPT
jgi:hypothetical protein